MYLSQFGKYIYGSGEDDSNTSVGRFATDVNVILPCSFNVWSLLALIICKCMLDYCIGEKAFVSHQNRLAKINFCFFVSVAEWLFQARIGR